MEKELDNLLSKPVSYYKKLILKNSPKFDFKKPVILFGAAKLSPHFIKFFSDKGTQILSLSDNDKNKIGKKMLGIKIIDKREIEKKFGKDVQIVVCSVYFDEIIENLKKLKFTKIFNPMFFFTLYHEYFNLLVWKNNLSLIFENKKIIKKVFESLQDEKSKKIFVEILKFRLSFNKSILDNLIDKGHEYFDKKIIKLTSNEVFLDGGAFDGDTIKQFLIESENKFTSIYSYEPDDKTYSLLNKYVKKLSDNRIVINRIGLGDKKQKLHFTNEGNLGSRITDIGSRTIEIIPIDSIKKNIITYIKLDIEGFERQSLNGAKITIAKNKPKLAICSYHNMDDLWEVPFLINKINKNYKFYLRHYTNFLFETVCYAT